MAIERIAGRSPLIATAGAGRVRGGGGVFSVPGQTGGVAEAGLSSGLDAIGATGILALQEGAPETVGDRPARRRGQEMLDELAILQRDLLTPAGPSPGTLRRLAGLADDLPLATSPGLRDAVAAIRLRAVVELARYGLME